MSSFEKLNKSKISLPKATAKEDGNLCPDCDGYGNIIENGRARPCHCRMERELRERFDVARIPLRYHSCRLDNFITESADQKKDLQNMRNCLQQMLEEPGRGLYLCGENGTGKTHLAISILIEMLRHHKSGIYYNVVDLLDSMRESIQAGSGPGGKEMLGGHMSCDILLLDDLGVQRASPWVIERLHAIINARYEGNQVLIITSNKNINEATANLNMAITSRIREMCIPYVMMNHVDYRERPTKKPRNGAAGIESTPAPKGSRKRTTK
jgi:DNA replication protein DnaC